MGYSNSDLMKIAIEEHKKCSEYPRVGAVVAKDGALLSTGRRGEERGRHAERIAIEKLSEDDVVGATIFTTLEPCVALQSDQSVVSCADLIVSAGIKEVFIGVLDPNGTIYSKGQKRLLDNNVSVKFFSRRFRAEIEKETFDYGELNVVYGSGKRRVPVVRGGIFIDVQFSATDVRRIPLKWDNLQPTHGHVDLYSSNDSVKVAAGVEKFSDITDPTVFRFPSHYARMTKGMVAIVHPGNVKFYVLIKLLELFGNDIYFQWEVRNDPL